MDFAQLKRRVLLLVNFCSSIRGTVPLWTINGPITLSQMAAELDEIHSKGIEEIIVKPCFPDEVGFTPDDWMEVFGWCVELAKERGMRIWISENFNRPNGLRTENIDPATMSKHLAVRAIPRQDIDMAFFEPGQFLLAGRLEGGAITRTRTLSDVQALIALDGNWVVFNCHLKRAENSLDTLSESAVSWFIERTCEPYRTFFSEDFGTTIGAFFVDEPSIYRMPIGCDDWTIPYTDRLFQSFEEKYRYSALLYLPYLFYPGQDAYRFRADFWCHIASIFDSSFRETIHNWLKENNLAFTGQGEHDNTLRCQVRFQGDVFAGMSKMSIPGINYMGKEAPGSHGVSILQQKIASSLAHTQGLERALSQSFADSGWDITYLDLKKIVDQQFAHGINLLVPHALFHTIGGSAKHEDTPSLFVQSPFWEDFDAFTAYVNRLSEMLTGGEHICNIALLYPVTGLFAAYQPDRNTQEFEAIDSVLGQLCSELTRRQLDFDLIDFSTLSSAAIENGSIVVANERYDILVVPYTPYMQPAEYNTIGRIAQEVKTHFFYRSADPIAANIPSSNSPVHFVLTEDLPGFVMRLRHSMDDGIHLTGTGREDILLLQRKKEDTRIAFLVNRSGRTRRVAARFTDRVAVERLEPETGKKWQLQRRMVRNKTETMLHFDPYQSFFLIIDETNEGHLDITEPEMQVSEIQLDDLTVSTSENIAPLFHFRHALSGEEIDLRESAELTLTERAGKYDAEISIAGNHDSIRLVLDRDYSNYGLMINGTTVHPVPTFNWLTDPSDIAADVTELLREGRNVITVIPSNELKEPVRLAGHFDVDAGSKGTKILPRTAPNPFHLEKSMPFYCGTVAYKSSIDIPAGFNRASIDLGRVYDTAALYINGNEVGKRLWPPYTFDITNHIKPGANEIRIEVRANLAPLILGRTRPLGLRTAPILRIETSD